MKEIKLQPCPFCGRIPDISICDNEGNIRDEPDYEESPWSGLSFAIKHEHIANDECPIASHEDELIGTRLYYSREELTERWNKRIGNQLTSKKI